MTTRIAPVPQPAVPAEAGVTKEAEPKAATTSRQMFLELLIAQLRHQNPLEPMNGAEFLSQLAEFSALEQMVAIREEIASLREALVRRSEQGAETDSQP